MPIICSQCSQSNPDQSGFCVRCGNRLQSNEHSSSGPSQALYAASASSGQTGPSPYAASVPSYSPPPPPSSPPGQSRTPPAYPPGTQPYAQYSYPVQMGTGQGQISIRRAFAGKGTLLFHHSWLLNGQHVEATTVRTTILDILRQRNITGLSIVPERLMERGVLTEERDYLTTHRGVSTVFIYAAPAGQDLYISRATTVLPAISSIRVVILILLVFLALFGPALFSSMINGFAAYILASFLSFLTLPIWLFLIWLLIRSFIHWLVEKDFWVYLRPNVLNDFQLDDIALLEHVTDDTIHAAVERLGLDASKIVPPSKGYQQQRRIRIF